MLNDQEKYDLQMKKLISVLHSIFVTDEYTIIYENGKEENLLEFGIVGQSPIKIKFENLNGENFWEFIYKGIYMVNPDSIIDIIGVNDKGNIHKSMIIHLNDRVKAIVINKNHKYDELIFKIQKMIENEPCVLDSNKPDKRNIRNRKIKELNL